MKTLKYILILSLIIGISSCKKDFFTGVNENENLPADVPSKVLLPSAEAQLSFAMGGDASRYISVNMQYVTGAARQFASYQRYSYTENDFDNLWRLNLYAGPMQDLNIIIQKSKAGGFKHYQGIAQVLMAYSLGLTTDLWGAIPYKDAFQGADKLQPAFDTQESIYGSIQSLLSESITLLAATDASVQQPGSDDIIYGGDPALWLQLAYGLKARYEIHLANKFGASHATAALTYLANGLTSNGDDAQLVYGVDETAANPWYQYIEQRDDIAYDGTCLQSMTAKSDPRYAVYIDVNGDYWGPGYLGPYFSAAESSFPFFTYYEQKFIEAEAKLRTGDNAGAAIALGEAVSANMDKLGVDPTDAATYIAANVTVADLPTIMYEKYVAMFLQPESWTDWRRSYDATLYPNGLPALTANSGNVTSNQIPRRFIYPSSERLYNSNTPQSSTLFSPALYWDPH